MRFNRRPHRTKPDQAGPIHKMAKPAPASSVAAGVPTWVSAWLIISGLVCIWDASFVLLRPRSLPGGDLAHVFSPCK